MAYFRTYMLRRAAGFTVLEIMVISAILSLLALLAIPGYLRARRFSDLSRMMQELRTTGNSFEVYAADHNGTLPPTSRFSKIPEGMNTYMPKGGTWERIPPGGGYWTWLSFDGAQIWGMRGLVTILDSGFTSEEMLAMDENLDDGNLESGGMRTYSRYLFFGVE